MSAATSEEKEPLAPHASGKGPLSRFELTNSLSSAGISAHFRGSVLRTDQFNYLDLPTLKTSNLATSAQPGGSLMQLLD